MQELTERSAGVSAELQEKVLLGGDLARLTPAERLSYYNAVCTSVGLNPLTRPFEYLTLNGKMMLYARKDCTDQLRDMHGVSIQIVGREVVDGVYVVTAQAKNMTERTDESIGAVPLPSVPADKANAMMKAETKAKRRVTLSICGLGILDETELDTVPQAKVVNPQAAFAEKFPEQAKAIAEKLQTPPAKAPPLPPEARTNPTYAAVAWSEMIALSETITECSMTLNRMEADPALDLFAKTQLRDEGKAKVLALRKGKA